MQQTFLRLSNETFTYDAIPKAQVAALRQWPNGQIRSGRSTILNPLGDWPTGPELFAYPNSMKID